jgi:hypothetical protein
MIGTPPRVGIDVHDCRSGRHAGVEHSHVVVQLPDGVEGESIVSALGDAGVQRKPYLRAIHLPRPETSERSHLAVY